MENLYTLIMAGGSGTRFWPVSKTAKPKQYLSFFNEDSLLQSTIKRFAGLTTPNNIFVVSHQGQKEILEQQTRMLTAGNLIYEPVGKNTLPCIGLAAMFAELDNPEGIMVVSPADHAIANTYAFKKSIKAAVDLAASSEGIVTIGIKPDYPATGFGYVQTKSELRDCGHEVRQFEVSRFVEKPDKKTAESYLNQGGFYWNSGLFIFRISVFLNEFKRIEPDLFADLKKIQASVGTPSYEEALDSIYRSLKSISIDYGIMEHTKKIYLVEGDFGWNDLGSWESIYQLDKKDENGNAGNSEAIFLNSNNSYIYTDDSLVTVVGLDNVIVVKEGDTVLVCNRTATEEIKAVVDQLKAKNKFQYI